MDSLTLDKNGIEERKSIVLSPTIPSTITKEAWGYLLPTGSEGLFAFVPKMLPPRISWNAQLDQTYKAAAHFLGELSKLSWIFDRKIPFLSRCFNQLRQRRKEREGSWNPYAGEEKKEEYINPSPLLEKSYIEAIENGYSQLHSKAFLPDLACLLHKVLLRGCKQGEPGKYRTVQIRWTPRLSGSTMALYLPPPPELIKPCLESLSCFYDMGKKMPPLVVISLVHLQFVSIQPFEDANRRVANLLASLFWVKERFFPFPLLDLTGYFEWSAMDFLYYFLKVIRQGAWEDWLLYYFRGVAIESRRAYLFLKETIKKEF